MAILPDICVTLKFLSSKYSIPQLLKVRAKINSQILGIEAPVRQGVQALEYQDISAVGQRSWAGWIGV
jgi:hypothetical protein